MTTLERTIAENPEVVAAAAGLVGYNSSKFINKTKNLLNENAKIRRRLKYRIASEDGSLVDELLNMEKVHINGIDII